MKRKIFAIALCALTMSITGFASDDKGKDVNDDDSLAVTQQIGSQRLTTSLTGPTIRHEAPKGHADFRLDTTKNRMDFTVEVEDVNFADGTVLTVKVANHGAVTAVGTIKLALQRGELELRSQDGDTVPQIHKGEMVTVWRGTTAILAGIF